MWGSVYLYVATRTGETARRADAEENG